MKLLFNSKILILQKIEDNRMKNVCLSAYDCCCILQTQKQKKPSDFQKSNKHIWVLANLAGNKKH